nr:hypothetical protein Iba_chr09bCG9750 [Ipomoea batatas]
MVVAEDNGSPPPLENEPNANQGVEGDAPPEAVQEGGDVVVAGEIAPAGQAGDFTCEICGARYPTEKALFGHLRCHKDRGWRGAFRPPTFTMEEFAEYQEHLVKPEEEQLREIEAEERAAAGERVVLDVDLNAEHHPPLLPPPSPATAPPEHHPPFLPPPSPATAPPEHHPPFLPPPSPANAHPPQSPATAPPEHREHHPPFLPPPSPATAPPEHREHHPPFLPPPSLLLPPPHPFRIHLPQSAPQSTTFASPQLLPPPGEAGAPTLSSASIILQLLLEHHHISPSPATAQSTTLSISRNCSSPFPQHLRNCPPRAPPFSVTAPPPWPPDCSSSMVRQPPLFTGQPTAPPPW